MSEKRMPMTAAEWIAIKDITASDVLPQGLYVRILAALEQGERLKAIADLFGHLQLDARRAVHRLFTDDDGYEVWQIEVRYPCESCKSVHKKLLPKSYARMMDAIAAADNLENKEQVE